MLIKHRVLFNYVVAVTSVLVVFALRYSLDPVLGEVSPVILFLIPVAFSAKVGGLGPGLVATLLGGGIGIAIFSNPGKPPAVQHGPLFFWLARGIPFLIAGTIISLFAAQAEKARQRATQNEEHARESAKDARSSEEFVRRIMASSTDCIKVLDLDGKLVSINDNAKFVLEIGDLTPLLGTCWSEWWNSERSVAAAAVEEAKAGRAGKFTAFCPTAAGTPKWWDVTVTPIPGADGKPEKLLSVSRDVTRQRVADEAVRHNEEQQRCIFESVTDFSIFTTDLRGLITSWSAGAERLFGYGEAEALGMAAAAVFTPEDRDRNVPEREMAAALQTGRGTDDRWHLRKDGSRFFVSGVVTPLRDNEGNVIGFTKVARDVTQQQEMRQQLDEARRRSEAGLLAAEVGTFEWDIETNRMYGDENFSRIFKIILASDRSAPLERYLEIIHRDDVPHVKERIAYSVETGQDYEAEYRIVTDDKTRWVLARGRMIKDEAGRVVRFPGVLIDITARKIAEAALVVERHLLEAMFTEAPAAMALWVGRDLVFERINPLYQEIFPGRKLAGRPLLEACPDLRGQGFDQMLLNVIDTGTPFVGHEVLAKIARSDGVLEDHYFDFSYIRIKKADGSSYGVFDHAIDVTERVVAKQRLEGALQSAREAQEVAEQASRMKDDFLATISHELRTPLSAITGWASLLQTVKNDKEMLDEGIEVIARNANAQSQLIEDILDVARITTGKVRINVKQIDLRQPIAAAIATVSNAAKAKDITITTDHFDGPAEVMGDPDRLQQVFWNLLANAIKFSDRGDRIVIGLQESVSRLLVSVSDTGKGIDPEFLPNVFDRFRQADMSSTRRKGGLGLGLSIVRHLVELHGGTVSVDSQGIGHGSTFTVDLPFATIHHEKGDRDPITVARRSAEFNCSPVLDGARVLVVDDEPDARRVIQATLALCGTEVTIFSNVADALGALIADQSYDAVVSDIGMPDEDGYVLIKRLRDMQSRGLVKPIPVTALTAYTRETDREAVLAAGFDHFLTKPVKPAELLQTVAAMVAAQKHQ